MKKIYSTYKEFRKVHNANGNPQGFTNSNFWEYFPKECYEEIVDYFAETFDKSKHINSILCWTSEKYSCYMDAEYKIVVDVLKKVMPDFSEEQFWLDIVENKLAKKKTKKLLEEREEWQLEVDISSLEKEKEDYEKKITLIDKKLKKKTKEALGELCIN